MALPEVVFAQDFLGSVSDLDGAMVKRVMKSVDQFSKDPNHSSLNFHPIEGDRSGRLYSIRANDDVRVLLSKEGNLHTFLEAGHHDALYERALRGRFVINPGTGFIGMVEVDRRKAPGTESDAAGPAPAREVKQTDGPRPFDHWTDSELSDAGLGTDEIAAMRTCRNEDDLCEIAEDLDDETFDLMLQLMEQTPEQWFAPTLDPEAEAEARLRTLLLKTGALNGLSPIFDAEEVARIAAAPIEEWMIFLHPDQRSVVERKYDGPARIRGSAGTGKTVVALHRAAELAHRFRAEADETGVDALPILFTTYIKSLPPVFEKLYNRLPNAIPNAVEFVHVDRLAFRICREGGRTPTHDPRAIEAAFRSAAKQVLRSGKPLVDLGLTPAYLRAEVTSVIKGRGVRSVDEYLGVERTGRRTRLLAPHRTQVWELREAWDAEMAKRGTTDFVDTIVLARDLARQRPGATYRAALIDEAQDLNLVGLQLIRTLVNGGGPDKTDGLLVVGDGAQRIYPGGFTLRQAGVEVRGRTTVLRVNYRNTATIIGTAMAVAGAEAVDDLGEQFKRGEADAEAHRKGGTRPIYVRAASEASQLLAVIDQVTAYRDDLDDGVDLGDIAVCAPSNRQVKAVTDALRKADIPVIDLKDYDGQPTEQVKVGTFHRVKGLEFKVVFLVDVGAGQFPRARIDGQSEVEYAEEVSTQVSTLFVAMTRARDALVLLGVGEPAGLVAEALDRFEVVDC